MLVGGVYISPRHFGYPKWETVYRLAWRTQGADGAIRHRSEHGLTTEHKPRGMALLKIRRALCSLVKAKHKELGAPILRPVLRERLPLAMALDLFTVHTGHTHTERTTRRYRAIVSEFVEHCQADPDCPIDSAADLTQPHIAHWRDRMVRYYGYGPFCFVCCAVQGFLNWLLERELLARVLTVLSPSSRKQARLAIARRRA